MRAIAFGADGFSGDSEFYTDASVEFVDDDSFETLEARYNEEYRNDDDLEPEDYDPIEGFWIVEEKTFVMINDDEVPHSDSETYAQNRKCKKMAAKLAVQTIKRPS